MDNAIIMVDCDNNSKCVSGPMSYRLQENFGPYSTPKAIRTLILITSLTTLVLALTEGLLRYLTGLPSLAQFLSLSYPGISHGFLWQPLTYFLFYASFGEGITLSLVITLLFQMYLLWIAGTAVFERVGNGPFIRLYFIAGGLSGLAALALMKLTGAFTVLSGAEAPLLAVLVVWAMLYPETELLLFFTVPVKVVWLIFGYLGIVLLIDLSHANLVDFFFTLASALIGYLYATVAWDMHSPFAFTAAFDSKLNNLGRILRQQALKRPPSSSKIVPLHPEKTSTSDEEFLDAMLAKISKHGEASLSWRERRRLNRISRSKKGQ